MYVDNQEIGRTPVSTSFIYYGTRNIRLELAGYETIEELHRIDEPWYQIPPIDFVSDNLIPREIRDERALEFQMIPRAVVPRGQLIERANDLRRGFRLGVVAPLPGAGRQSVVPVPEAAASSVGGPVVTTPSPGSGQPSPASVPFLPPTKLPSP